MASELRVNSSTNRSGLGTITYTDSGPIVSGVGTFANGLTVDGTQTTVKSLKLTGDSYNVNWFKTSHKLRFNDNAKATFGTADDLEIYHNGSNTILDNTNTGAALHLKSPHQIKLKTGQFVLKNTADSENIIYAAADNKVSLYYDGTERFQTTSSGVTVTGDVSIGNDTGKFLGGASNDIQLYHDGSHSVLDNLTGGLFIKGGDTTNGIVLQNRNGNESLAKFIPDGAVELYHDNTIKFQTTSSGATVTGQLLASSGFKVNDGVHMTLGTDNDFKFYHDGSNAA